jgi:hypothetical protein
LHSSPEADRGAPIVGPDDIVESGNGRVEAIRRAHAAGRGDAYRQMIERQGHTIPPGIEHPVLIRRRTTPMDDATRQDFVREANTSATMALSSGEQAKADADALRHDTLTKLNPDLTGGVLAAGNRDFVRSWLSGLSDGERNKLTATDGSLSQDGARRLQGALIAKAYGDPATVNRLTESTDKEMAAVSGALTDAAPALASLRAAIEAGRVPAELDISKPLMRAVDLARVSREKGQAPGDILNSSDMFNPIDRTTGALVRALHDPKMTRLASRVRIAGILRGYAQEALRQNAGGDLAGGTKLDPGQYINAQINKAAVDKPDQGGLFGPGVPKPEPAAPPAPAPAAPAAPAPEPVKPNTPSGYPHQYVTTTQTDGAWRVAINGRVPGDSPGYNTRAQAEAAARAHVDDDPEHRTLGPRPAPTPTPAAKAAPPAPPAPAPTPVLDPDKARALQIKKLTATIKKERERLDQIRAGLPNDPAIPRLEATLAKQEAQLAKLQAAAKAAAPAAPPASGGTRTDTPAFQRWFGESKVRQPDGQPLRMYHGTTTWTRNGLEFGNIQAFNRNAAITYVGRRPGMDMVGSWFTDQTGDPADPEHGANLYAAGADKGAIYPVYLSIKNPLVARPQGNKTAFDVLADHWNAWHTERMAALRKSRKKADKEALESLEKIKKPGNPDVWGDPDGFQAHLKAQGYDGIHLDPFQESLTAKPQQGWIAFDPEQIKSAVGNKGTWDPQSPDIAADFADTPAAAAERLGDATIPGALPQHIHHTDRPSHFMRQVAEQAGVADPDAFVSKPTAAQAQLLVHALVDKYDLAGIEVAKEANPRETLDQLADALHNMQFLAYGIGAPNKALGFGQKLSLWLGPRDHPKVSFGGGQAFGVYVPSERMIYMPGRSNSFAHEWTHALDHELADKLAALPKAGELLSRQAATWEKAPAGSPEEAFAKLMATIFGRGAAKDTLAYLVAQTRAATAPTPANARALQQARAAYKATRFVSKAAAQGGPYGAYLTQPFEMLARSHESFIGNRVAAAGGTNEFLTKPEAVYLHEADKAFHALYPDGDERMAIFAAWDELHNQLRLKALYPQGVPANPPRNDLGGLGPLHWGQYANVKANPALVKAQTALINRQVNQAGLIARTARRMGFNSAHGSDPGYLTAGERAQDVGRAATFSPRGQMNAIHERVPAAAKGPTRELIDHLTTDPGAGRFIKRTFEEEVHQNTRRDFNAYAVAANRAGLAKTTLNRFAAEMDDATANQLHEMMTQRQDVSQLPDRIQKAIRDNTINRMSPADQATLRSFTENAAPRGTPANVRRFASDLRFMLDQRYYDLRQAGFEVDYKDGFFPRHMDDHRIYAEPDRFERDAARAMAIRAERETEADGEDLVGRFREHSDAIDQQTRDDINKAIAAARKRLLASGQNTEPTAEQLVPSAAHRAAIHRAWGDAKAKEWRRAVMLGSPVSFDTKGPRGNALKPRVMPPEADMILRDWYITDPHATITAYLHQTNRKIAYAKRFGANGKGIEDLLSRAEAGGMRPEDVRYMRDLAEQITGRARGSNKWPGPLRRGLEIIHAYGSMALMVRAPFSSLGEPMAVLLKTGNVKALAATWGHIVRDVARTGDAVRIAEVAEYIGIVAHSAVESVMADRTDATYYDSQNLNAMSVNYYRRIGMTGLNNIQRRAAMVGAQVHFQSLADTILKTPGSPAVTGKTFAQARTMENARAMFRELGIPEADQADFSRWLKTIKNGPPDIAELVAGGKHGQYWAEAMGRMVDMMIQDPKVSEKPMVSQDPLGKIIFGLMGFNYGFQGNVMDAYFKNAHRQLEFETKQGSGAGGKARVVNRVALRMFGGVAAAVFVSYLFSSFREALFNGATWDEKENEGTKDEWLLDLAVQRSGLNGTLDPIMQALTGAKYSKSFSALFAGTQTGFYADALTKMLLPFAGGGSPHTNTSTYNAIEAAYSTIVSTAAAAVLTGLPGGNLLNTVYTTAMMKATSRSAGDAVASWLVGPKGSGDETTAPQTDVDAPERDDEDAADKKAESSGPIGNLVAVLADDLLPVLARNASKVPRSLRWLGGVGLGLYGAERFREHAGRFTEPPPGKRGED